MQWLPEYARTWVIMCERSGRIRDALLARGIPAISCDTMPTRAPGPHLQCDAREIIHWPWPAMIAHPVCKFLSNSGAKHLYVDGRRENGMDFERWNEMAKGAEFYRVFSEAHHIPLRAVENPVMHSYGAELVGHTATQFVHPYHFGSPFQKATGFKLYGLEPLPVEYEKSDWFPGTIKQAVWLMGEGKDRLGRDREERRSETDPEVARAVAQYWGPIIFENRC